VKNHGCINHISIAAKEFGSEDWDEDITKNELESKFEYIRRYITPA
jgi:hypothetical protein